jgi:hypothetical protein
MVSYFSLDDILTEAEVLPCTFLTDANSLGYLDDRNDDDDVQQASIHTIRCRGTYVFVMK